MDVDGEECQVKHRRKLVAGVHMMVEMADSGLLVLYGTQTLQMLLTTESRYKIIFKHKDTRFCHTFMIFYTSKLQKAVNIIFSFIKVNKVCQKQ